MPSVHVFHSAAQVGPLLVQLWRRQPSAAQGGSSPRTDEQSRPEGSFMTGCINGLVLSLTIWALVGVAAYLI